MIPFCAKQGVEQKISFPDFLSAMLSDYECAYACGLAARRLGIKPGKEDSLGQLKEAVKAAIPEDLSGLDYRTANLYKLIGDYELTGFSTEPEEIPVLITMGLESDFLDQQP
ncbi:MAG: DUF3837 domain-containing protein [Lachnospiraceae bacterium]|nr:DUF3837 domain-containing protein [Lachnospiraceae bacterium]